MQRNLFSELLTWKNSKHRKPLLLRGARQTGKTWILKEFGRINYKKTVYCNFEEEPELEDLFSSSLRPKEIITKLSILKQVEILPDDTLIIFDEIQHSSNAIVSLKYFYENIPEFNIATAGSLLGVKLSKPKSFPVGKVDIAYIFPMNFQEFLLALGEIELANMLQHIQSIEPIPLPIHNKLIDILKLYYVVGGMPEAVARYVETRSLEAVRKIHNDILDLYVLDFAKHAPKEDIQKLSIIWNSIPTHLARENKKFIFSAVAESGRARSYENAIQWLIDAGLIYKARAIEHIEQPLSGYASNNSFKIYSLDTGLLATQSKLPIDIFVKGNDLFNTYNGAFVENYVAQQLIAYGISDYNSLYYWRSKSGQAEVDFIISLNGKVFPLEVKAGINPKSKSMAVYNEQNHPDALLRTTLLNMMRNGSYINIPLYAAQLLDKLV